MLTCGFPEPLLKSNPSADLCCLTSLQGSTPPPELLLISAPYVTFRFRLHCVFHKASDFLPRLKDSGGAVTHIRQNHSPFAALPSSCWKYRWIKRMHIFLPFGLFLNLCLTARYNRKSTQHVRCNSRKHSFFLKFNDALFRDDILCVFVCLTLQNYSAIFTVSLTKGRGIRFGMQVGGFICLDF